MSENAPRSSPERVSTDGQHMAAVALGSNLRSGAGGRHATIAAAIERLRALGEVVAVSRLRETEPVGVTDQPRFVNGALLLRTKMGPVDLMRALLEIERGLGRVREAAAPKGPRTIDLDLLLVDDVVLHTPELTLPHPAMHQRRFVLEPLGEIAPAWRHPVLGRSVRELAQAVDVTAE